MILPELLDQLRSKGLRMVAGEADLGIQGRGDRLDPELRAALSLRKPDILLALASPIFMALAIRSKCGIERGERRRAQHSTTEILVCVFWMDGCLIVWVPTDDTDTAANARAAVNSCNFGDTCANSRLFVGAAVPNLIAEAARMGMYFCVHSVHASNRLVWEAKNLPIPGGWINTSPLASLSGWPSDLNELAPRILGRHTAIAPTQLLDRLNRDFQRGDAPLLRYDELRTLIRGTVENVLLQRDIYPFLTQNTEPDVIEVDRRINARGIGFDFTLASALLELERDQRSTATRRLSEATAGAVTEADLNRIPFLLAWLENSGVTLPNLRRSTVEGVLSQWRAQQIPLPHAVVTVLEARLAIARHSGSKLTKALELCSDDGRLRDQLVYHKGHTGRWAGWGVQLQNLPKPHGALTDSCDLIPFVGDIEASQSHLPPGVSVGDAVSSLIRPCFAASIGNVFCIADFASIEARGVAWCANEQLLLDSFQSGKDVYCDLASHFFPYPITREHSRERDIGKVAMLGCGYSMSGLGFGSYAAAREIDLAAAGVTAENIVEGYRNAYPAIAGRAVCENGRTWRVGGLWQDVEQAARNALSNHADYTAGRCCFQTCDNALRVTLPSGRKLYYRNARLVNVTTNGWTTSKPKIVYDLPDDPNEESYGGKLVENIVQAIGRDLLAAALVQCELQNLPVVLHVHDEIVIEVPERDSHECLSRLLQIMSTRPAWADGFPIEVEGFLSRRYVKSQSVGGATMAYCNGSRLR